MDTSQVQGGVTNAAPQWTKKLGLHHILTTSRRCHELLNNKHRLIITDTLVRTPCIAARIFGISLPDNEMKLRKRKAYSFKDFCCNNNLSCLLQTLQNLRLNRHNTKKNCANLWRAFPVNIQTTLIYNTSITFLCHIFHFLSVYFLFCAFIFHFACIFFISLSINFYKRV